MDGPFERYRAAIEQAIRVVCRCYRVPEAERQDFSQEVWLSLLANDWKALRKFQGRSSLQTYFVTIARRVLNKQRIRRKHEETGVDQCSQLEGKTASSEPIRGLPIFRPETNSINSPVSLALQSALDQLTRLERLWLQLRYCDGLKICSIADELLIPRREAYSRFNCLLVRLRGLLGQVGIGPEDLADALTVGGIERLLNSPRRSSPRPTTVPMIATKESAPISRTPIGASPPLLRRASRPREADA